VKNLAIIIPYFKIDYFAETLESLAKQTDKRFKVYIGDDASPYSPEELLKNYKGKFNFVYKRFKDNLGSISLTRQWERCIAMMQDEDWFMILGDDDLLTENVVHDFYKNLEEFSPISNVVRFSSQGFIQETGRQGEVFHHPKLENALDYLLRKLKGETRGSLSEYVFRKSSFQKYRFKDYFYGWTADDRAVLDFSEGKPIFSINTLVKVRNSEQSITGSKKNIDRLIESRKKSMKDLLLDYGNQLDDNQKKFIFTIFEAQFFKSQSVSVNDVFFLVKNTFEYFTLRYSILQLKSIFYKIILNKKD
jgi:glycosyltransferase involved in cell wall biosynthesis